MPYGPRLRVVTPVIIIKPLAREALEVALREALAANKRNNEEISEQRRQNACILKKLDSLQQAVHTQPGLTEEGKKARIAPGTTFKEPGCQKAYNRTLPLVEAVEDLERHTAMLVAANPDSAVLEHHVDLLQTDEHRTPSFPNPFWVGGVC